MKLFPLLLFFFSAFSTFCSAGNVTFSSPGNVTFDKRSLIINGQRKLLISASIHYPRSVPAMWAALVQMAKEGGADVIESYVFWNGHKLSPGKYYFGGRFDRVKFVKIVQDAGMYMILRIGPFVAAEGIPVCLHYIPGSFFRTDSEPFKVENEYGWYQMNHGELGNRYAAWAMQTALSQNIGGPWIMCQQYVGLPESVIDTCNLFYCDQFTPISQNKPKIWTENWPGWFQAFGGKAPRRPAEDIAFSVARFFQKGGSVQNYYMADVYTDSSGACAAFLSNTDNKTDMIVEFRNPSYHLPDCKNEVFNSAKSAGLYYEWTGSGLTTSVKIEGFNSGTIDYTLSGWKYKSKDAMTDMVSEVPPFSVDWKLLFPAIPILSEEIGLEGESLGIYKPNCAKWVSTTEPPKNQTLTWYKQPPGDDPIGIDMLEMGKGLAWLNGEDIGPYYIPRSWFKPSGKVLVIFEEKGGDPTKIKFSKRKISGTCGSYRMGDCHDDPTSASVVEMAQYLTCSYL
ncbi:hypothetical protein Patl1_28048 [Pistacia atlantica]|uniref:Uncharacterized protein n=1 Tax=Pistacia atlantica TaxID=434234 RepID=A0ACC1BE96_9ROSI|nr:hypothetical protein Patl1_28048 [Pistacia atlantica]